MTHAISIHVQSNLKWRFLTAAVSIMATIASACEQLPTGPVLFSSDSGGNDHYYWVVQADSTGDSCLTWHEAHLYAAAQRLTTPDGEVLWGHLATVTSEAENTFLTENLLVTGSHAWIGAYRLVGDTSSWAWITEEPWVYTNWLKVGAGWPWSEPTNMDGEEQVQMLLWGTCVGCWFDYHEFYEGEFAGPCDLTYGIVEFEKPFIRVLSISTPSGATFVDIRLTRSTLIRAEITDIAGTVMTDSDLPVQPMLHIRNTDNASSFFLPLRFRSGYWQAVLHYQDLPDKGVDYSATVELPEADEFTILGDAVFTIQTVEMKKGLRKTAHDASDLQPEYAGPAQAYGGGVKTFTLNGRHVARPSRNNEYSCGIYLQRTLFPRNEKPRPHVSIRP